MLPLERRPRFRPRTPPGRYVVAALLVVAATAAQWVLSPFLPSPQQFLFFYPAVVATAWIAGRGPGVFAACTSALVIAYFFLPPSFSITVSSPRDQLDLTIFVALATGLVLILDRLEKAIHARDRALRAAEDATNRLAEQEALLAAVIEHAPVGLAFDTKDGRVRLRNGSWRAIAEPRDGAAPETLRAAFGHRDLRGRDGQIISPHEWQCLLGRAERELVAFEAQARSARDEALWVSGRLAPVRAGEAEPAIGTVSVLHDVSAEHRVDELREEFVAVVTHDLRSPIATITLVDGDGGHVEDRFVADAAAKERLGRACPPRASEPWSRSSSTRPGSSSAR